LAKGSKKKQGTNPGKIWAEVMARKVENFFTSSGVLKKQRRFQWKVMGLSAPRVYIFFKRKTQQRFLMME
jgi:hypothetical protein